MLYIPTATLATPIIVQQTQTIPIQTTTTTSYYMLPTITPIVPVLSTAFLYPTYRVTTKPIEKIDTEKSQTSEVKQSVQHIIHHHPTPPPPPTCSIKHCSGCCELCCPWIKESPERQIRSRSPERQVRSRSPSPPTRDQQRYSRRDEYDQSKYNTYKDETIDEKIDRIRRELNLSSSSKHDKSTETIDYYHPTATTTTKTATTTEQRIPYKQHYDPPKPRPRSTSSQRSSSLPREPWRSTNQNDYSWRDAHLPAYRQATLDRSQTPSNERHQWNETAHQRSHLNTQNQSSYCTNNYIYRPKSETETRKYYTQTTGKNPDCEVYQNIASWCNKQQQQQQQQQQTKMDHSFYSDIPTTTLKQIDCTSCHRNDDNCLHIVPKYGSTLDPPYLKIFNAPVTYLH